MAILVGILLRLVASTYRCHTGESMFFILPITDLGGCEDVMLSLLLKAYKTWCVSPRSFKRFLESERDGNTRESHFDTVFLRQLGESRPAGQLRCRHAMHKFEEKRGAQTRRGRQLEEQHLSQTIAKLEHSRPDRAVDHQRMVVLLRVRFGRRWRRLWGEKHRCHGRMYRQLSSLYQSIYHCRTIWSTMPSINLPIPPKRWLSTVKFTLRRRHWM